jgi:hypothetical protein
VNGQGRFWIFFVIVAVGLVLSWGQVGRKTVEVLAEGDVAYLWTEEPCAPRVAPCAASASDVALVLGPAAGGLRLRAIGLPVAAVEALQAEYLDADAQVLSSLIIDAGPGPGTDGWPLPAADSAVRLRVYLEMPGRSLVAEFPL